MRCTEELKSCMSPLPKRTLRTGGYTESIARARNSYKLLWCWSANPLRVPFAVHLLPRGMAVPVVSDVSPFLSCPMALSAQGAIQCSDNYWNAHWPHSARPCPSSLGRGNLGKAVLLHCSCSPAAAWGLSGGTAVTADTEAVAQFNNLLASGLQILISKEQHSESSSILHPSPCFFFVCVHKYKTSED